MEEKKGFKGASADEAWEQFSTDITWQASANNYRAVIHTGKHDIELETVKSPGGGDEGWGFEQTSLRATLPVNNKFRFAITPEDVINRIGKFFGMQDVQIGYPEFDQSVLIQTNDEQRLKAIFANESLRETFQNLSGYTFHIDKAEDGKADHLHLKLQHAITDPDALRRLYSVFNHVLTALDDQGEATRNYN